MSTPQRYFLNVLLGFDQFGNILLLGDPTETISERTGRAYLSGKAKWFVYPLRRLIDKLANIIAGQTNHCVDAAYPLDQQFPDEIWSWQRSK